MMILRASTFLLAASVCAACVCHVGGSGSSTDIVVPGWDTDPFVLNGSHCVAADSGSSGQPNARWVWYAIPEGKPPAEGWPVFLHMPPWILYPVDPVAVPGSGPCIAAAGPAPPPPLLASCIAFIEPQCKYAGWSGNLSQCMSCTSDLEKSNRTAWVGAGCPPPGSPSDPFTPYLWCRHRGGEGSSIPVFEKPGTILQKCFDANGTFVEDECDFPPLAGQQWEMRLRQFLLANGVAIIQPNPGSQDVWEFYGQDTWDSGQDKPFFEAMFQDIRNGSFGVDANGNGIPLDLSRVVTSGYSVGAQMVSWMFQLQATGQLLLATIRGGMFFAGGTYGCYQFPPVAQAQCASCNISDSCTDLGCSLDFLARNATPCCNYCCPKNFTEQAFADDPALYAKHPPSFLVQHTTLDVNADTCAAKMYHEAMTMHGADSTLMLIPPDEERCMCVGNPGVSADALSPYLSMCATFLPGIGNTTCVLPPGELTPSGGDTNSSSSSKGGEGLGARACEYPGPDVGQRCMYHTMGFGGMILPAATWVKRVVNADAA